MRLVKYISVAVASLVLFMSMDPDLISERYAPSDWPEPVYKLEDGPRTQAQIDLGRMLFHEPMLSRDSSITCTSCHSQYNAFTHVDHKLSHGIDDRIGTRNSPVLVNLAWMRELMWDGSANHIEVQALGPLSNEAEMDASIDVVVDRLTGHPVYKTQFSKAYGDEEVTSKRVLKALSSFMLTMVSKNSKYDKVVRGEAGAQFTMQERKGYTLFRTHCGNCHKEPLFTNNKFMTNGLPVDPALNDVGRMKVTSRTRDSLMFKVPTLRNIEFSFPYMHDGRFKSLYEVLDHYSNGVEAHPGLSEQLKGGIKLSSRDKTDIVAFLLTLTDNDFLFAKEYEYPKHLMNPRGVNTKTSSND